jgi:hypothetical protein
MDCFSMVLSLGQHAGGNYIWYAGQEVMLAAAPQMHECGEVRGSKLV